MAAKKRKTVRAFIILMCFIALSIYGGMKGGEYLAQKLTKPINEDRSALDGAKSSGQYGTDYVLSENDMVSLTAVTTEFIIAEHMKKNDRLATLIDPDYYNTFLKSIKQLVPGEVNLQDIYYKEIDKEKVRIEIIFFKNSTKNTELLTLKKQNSIWKIAGVER